MKKSILLICISLLASVISHAQAFTYSSESQSEYDNGYSYSDIVYDNWQSVYYGNSYEIHYDFTAAGYFTYSITVYPGGFSAPPVGAYNELYLQFDNETLQTHFEDVSSPSGYNSQSITKSGSIYIGTPTSTYDFLFSIGFVSADGSKYGDVSVQCSLHW